MTPPSASGLESLVALSRPALVPSTGARVLLLRATRFLLGRTSLGQVQMMQRGLDLKDLLFFEWLQGTKVDVISGFP